MFAFPVHLCCAFVRGKISAWHVALSRPGRTEGSHDYQGAAVVLPMIVMLAVLFIGGFRSARFQCSSRMHGKKKTQPRRLIMYIRFEIPHFGTREQCFVFLPVRHHDFHFASKRSASGAQCEDGFLFRRPALVEYGFQRDGLPGCAAGRRYYPVLPARFYVARARADRR